MQSGDTKQPAPCIYISGNIDQVEISGSSWNAETSQCSMGEEGELFWNGRNKNFLWLP